MEQFISSDTNIWIDFIIIDKLQLPFSLPYTYLMSTEAVHDELLSPPNLNDRLLTLGLKEVKLTIEEFILAEQYTVEVKQLSRYDCMALAIAKIRKIVLMTGDGALRRKAEKEGVKVVGTIGILDELYEDGYIQNAEYIDCLKRLKKANHGLIRLPEAELDKRIEGGGLIKNGGEKN